MKKIKSSLRYALYCCILVFILSSCGSYSSLYKSSVQNVPLLTQKHELSIEAATGTANIGIQCAFAVTHHFALMGAYSYGQAFTPTLYRLISDGGTTAGFRNGGELALGYYSKLDPAIPFEIFGGVERYYRAFRGSSFSGGPKYAYFFDISSEITKPFMQADIGYRPCSWLLIGVSLRVGFLMYDHYIENVYTNSDTTGIFMAPLKKTTYTDIQNIAVAEPALTCRLGRKNLKFMFQTGLSRVSEYEYSLFYDVGLSWSLHPETVKREP